MKSHVVSRMSKIQKNTVYTEKHAKCGLDTNTELSEQITGLYYNDLLFTVPFLPSLRGL